MTSAVVLERVIASRARVHLAPASLTLDPGVHAFVGAEEDGASLLLAIVAGRVRPRGGRVTVLGREPSHPDVARSLAYVDKTPQLPAVLTVAELLALAARTRGEAKPDVRARLEAAGIAELAARRIGSLSPGEGRAVLLAEALTSLAKVVVLDEPYAGTDPRTAAALAGLVRARGQSGACVIVGTASLREAAELAGSHVLLDRGTLVHQAPAMAHLLTPGAPPTRLRVVTSEARQLVVALAADGEAFGIESDRGSVTLIGQDIVALARAVARAAAQAKIDVEGMRVETPPLAELRASLAGDAAAAYQAAMERRRASASVPPFAPGGLPGGTS